MELHVVFHGMMVFVRMTGDRKIRACLLKTPKLFLPESEHAYLLITSTDGSTPTQDLTKGDTKSELTVQGSSGPGKGFFHPSANLIFSAQAFSIEESCIAASLLLPFPDEINGARFCQPDSASPIFSGADKPGDPIQMPIAHVFSYCDIRSASLTGNAAFHTSGDPINVIAIHAEETGGPPQPAHDGHMRHVRNAIRKGGAPILLKYEKARTADPARPFAVCKTTILPMIWFQSIPEKIAGIHPAVDAVNGLDAFTSPNPGSSESPLEDNPCWRYVIE